MSGPARTSNGIVLAAALIAVAAFLGALLVGAVRDSEPQAAEPECVPAVEPGWSVARHWNEALLAAIRLDVPSPTVHARNLYHSSAAMWDVWAAYEPEARGLFVDEERSADDVEQARNEAISHAVYGILEQRYLLSPGAEESITGFEALMADLCLDPTFTATDGDSPAAFGNRVAQTILAATIDDGSNEADGYTDPDYEPVNPPLVVAETGTTMVAPDRWQPLELDVMVAQNGMPLDETVQEFVGPHWGSVTPFALEGPAPLPVDPGPPPLSADPQTAATFQQDAVEVIAYSALLDPTAEEVIDSSPAARGDVPLGTYEARGRATNPVTGAPYAPNPVPLGDYGRVVAEFWADGPSSETPPGHWNTIANSVTDALEGERRLEGTGPVLDALEWDVKLYLALNGAVHDAAVAGWGAKGHYDYARPISMIRYMGGLGQSSDPDAPSYHPDGLPLATDLVEVITEQTTRPDARHAGLAGHEGAIAVRAWRGAPPDPEEDIGGVGWILAEDWVPYQLPTFVTPAFAGYVSGHSTFSRAAAEVLTAATGSEYFPGGLAEWTVPAGSLEFEAGPDEDVTLQWATYQDASDEAGSSRLYGGIHVRADDLEGRRIGVDVGRDAWALARCHYDDSCPD